MKYRHGDVQITKVSSIPSDAKKKDNLILAYGEKTGHMHQVDVGELFEARDGLLYLKVEKLAEVDHQEHPASPLTPGVYFVNIKRQHSPDGGWQRVVD
jgi:hypothetical protein